MDSLKLKSAGWVVAPLIVGLGIGFAMARSQNSEPAAGKAVAAPKQEAKVLGARAEPSPAQPAVAKDDFTTPETLEDLLALAENVGNHNRVTPAVLGQALANCPDEDIASWYTELLKLEPRSSPGQASVFANSALAAVAEQLARRLPDLALEEALAGNGNFPELLVIAHPRRLPEFLRKIDDPKLRLRMLFEHLMGINGSTTEETDKLRRDYVEKHGNDADLAEFDSKLGAALHKTQLTAGSPSKDELLAKIQPQNGERPNLDVLAAEQLAKQFQSAQAAFDFAAANGIDKLSMDVRKRFYGKLLQTYAREDPAAAGAWLSEQEPEMIKSALGQSINSFAALNPEAAITVIDGIDSKQVPPWLLRNIAIGLSRRDDGSGALDWYLSKADRKNSHEVNYAIQQIMTRDPTGVIKFINEDPDFLNDADPYSLGAVLGHLASEDLGNPVELIAKAKHRDDAPTLWTNVARKWARTNSAAVRNHIEREIDPAVQQAMINGLGISGSAWNESLEWTRGLDGSVRDQATQQLLLGAHRDPATSAEITSEWLVNASAEVLAAKETEGAIQAVGKALAEDSPTEAGEWATGLPEGAARESAIASVASKWSSFDPAGTSEWLVTLPPSEARDTAVAHLVTNINDDPVGAFSWSLIIEDPVERAKQLDGVVKRWRHSDPEAARAAIESADELSPAEQQQLIHRIDDAQ